METVKLSDGNLNSLYSCLSIARKTAPDITLAALMALLFVAQETGARDWSRIPTVKKVAKELGLTISGASRIIEVLSAGRTHGVKVNKGLRLITNSEFLFARKAAFYFLTPKGVTLIKQILADREPGSDKEFDPYNESTLLMLAAEKTKRAI